MDNYNSKYIMIIILFNIIILNQNDAYRYKISIKYTNIFQYFIHKNRSKFSERLYTFCLFYILLYTSYYCVKYV